MSGGPGGAPDLARALGEQQDRLLPCVHCGFCLPACPTYLRLGDEADSPRGRLHLMQAVVEGRIDAGNEAFRTHIDRCLGCRACEPVCPSGVEYGTLLEHAREASAAARAPGLLTRGLLAVMGSRLLRTILLGGGRILRATGVARLGTRLLPENGRLAAGRFGLAMLEASRPWRPGGRAAQDGAAGPPRAARPGAAAGTDGGAPLTARPRGPESGIRPPSSARRVGVLEGCVQRGLFGRVNAATRRVLEVNGFEVVPVPGQDCCGALHAHAGSLERARALARRNILAFDAAGVDRVAVNAAGCGAGMKGYAHLLEGDREMAERAAAFVGRVRDVSELLAETGPRVGGEIREIVAYDHPCHLLHAQGVRDAPLEVLAAVPGLEVRVIRDAEECCGGAGIYGITHPELGGWIGGDKVRAVCESRAGTVATPNPGCMMQIGVGLRSEGSRMGVAHPVEVLDESYRRAGYYEEGDTR